MLKMCYNVDADVVIVDKKCRWNKKIRLFVDLIINEKAKYYIQIACALGDEEKNKQEWIRLRILKIILKE